MRKPLVPGVREKIVHELFTGLTVGNAGGHYATLVAVGFHGRRGGVSEATDFSGEELGCDRRMTMARGLNSSKAARIGTELAQAVRAFRGGVTPQDDETIMVLERLSTGDRPQ